MTYDTSIYAASFTPSISSFYPHPHFPPAFVCSPPSATAHFRMFHSLRDAASQAANSIYNNGLAMTRSLSSSRTIRPRSSRRTSTALSASAKPTSSSSASECMAWMQSLPSGQSTLAHPPQHVSEGGWLDSDPFAFNIPVTQPDNEFAASLINLSRNTIPQRPRTRHGRKQSDLTILIAPPLSASDDLWPEPTSPKPRAVDPLEEASKVLAVLPGILDVRPDVRFFDDGYEESLRRRQNSRLSIT